MLPSPEDFYLNIPIYNQYEFEISNLKELMNVLFFTGNIDCYCEKCEKTSTFLSINNNPKENPLNSLKANLQNDLMQPFLTDLFNSLIKGPPMVITKEFECTRNRNHHIAFTFVINGNKLTKIGQFPSLADLNQTDIGKYRKVLSKEKFTEFSKGIGLSSHGVGIGSFVYLRRIFESLINEAHIKVKEIDGWDESLFQTSRMDEKIKLLRTELPEFLVENRQIYGILSKGIHELSESECLELFPHVRLGIELILDEKINKLEQENKIKMARTTITRIHEALKAKIKH